MPNVKYLRQDSEFREYIERTNTLINFVMDYRENAGDPTSVLTPDFIGQWCLDTTNSNWYRSVGLTSADWKIIT